MVFSISTEQVFLGMFAQLYPNINICVMLTVLSLIYLNPKNISTFEASNHSKILQNLHYSDIHLLIHRILLLSRNILKLT